MTNHGRIVRTAASFAAVVLCACAGGTQDAGIILWEIDTLDVIGGLPVEVAGDPQVVGSPYGKAVRFDGVDDGLFIPENPLAGASAFTLEILFRPARGGTPEQRFLHVQEDGTDHRYLIETRLDGDRFWIDTFIAGGDSSQTLADRAFNHPLDEWHTAALVYDGAVMRQYVDGIEELSAAVPLSPIGPGSTSVGVRINRVYWFKGDIARVRFARQALNKDLLLRP